MGEGVEPARERRVPLDSSRVDELSLRDLYLILRGGLFLIVVVAVVCGVAAYFVMGPRGNTYSTAATVSVAPPPVGSSALSGLELSIPTGVDFDTYRSIAFDRELIVRVILDVDFGGAEPDEVPEDLLRATYIETRETFELRSRTSASQARGHLIVEHKVTTKSEGSGVDRATRMANSWAATTAAAVSDLMTTPLEQAIEAVSSDVAQRRVEFDEASEAWSEFLGIDERRAINERLDALTDLDSSQRARLAEVESTVAAAEARVIALEGALALRTDVSDASARLLSEQLDVLVGERAAVQAERDHLVSVLSEVDETSAALRGRLTELESLGASLQRDLSTASMSFYRVAPTVSTLELQRELVARSAAVALMANKPILPEPNRAFLTAVGAAAVAGLLATLFVFVRAAVREPRA